MGRVHLLLNEPCRQCGGRRVVTYVETKAVTVEIVSCEHCDTADEGPDVVTQRDWDRRSIR